MSLLLDHLRLKSLRSPVLCAVVLSVCGCQMTQKTYHVDRPSGHRVKTDAFEIRSNFPIADDADLVGELTTLKEDIVATLKLPRQRDPVVLYLFSDEQSYRQYMHSTWPMLPPRRAYFVGTSRELAVYSFRSQFVEEDLRHEFTHGLLHASLNIVPLWLDEGLAEYFEVRGPEVGLPHTGHVQTLQAARSDGWNPSLYQLEHLTDFKAMTQRDYAEAWGWVHYMLHGDEHAQEMLVNYIADLKDHTVAPALMPRLEKATPHYYNGMTTHVTGMAGEVQTVGF